MQEGPQAGSQLSISAGAPQRYRQHVLYLSLDSPKAFIKEKSQMGQCDIFVSSCMGSCLICRWCLGLILFEQPSSLECSLRTSLSATQYPFQQQQRRAASFSHRGDQGKGELDDIVTAVWLWQIWLYWQYDTLRVHPRRTREEYRVTLYSSNILNKVSKDGHNAGCFKLENM